jgi:pimeloyl-ACP methyl ester carboxylesterase
VDGTGTGAGVKALLAALFALSSVATQASAADGAGRFVIMPVASQQIASPRVTVWLPPGYDGSKRRYAVVYMHDGQNLFDPKRSNFNKVWAADNSAIRLISKRKVTPFIIVGIDQPGAARHRQYLPQAIYDAAPLAVRDRMDALTSGAVYSDAYLRYMVTELKPAIDGAFRTRPGRDDTAIIGSSMGGLISCYAFGEYPKIFGRAACVSTHWPMSVPADPGEHLAAIDNLWRDYLARKFGKPDGRRVWFDHGTATLDAIYAPYQQAVDAQMLRLGWRKGRDFESRVYEGAAHDENAWALRMDDIFGWLMR